VSLLGLTDLNVKNASRCGVRKLENRHSMKLKLGGKNWVDYTMGNEYFKGIDV